MTTPAITTYYKVRYNAKLTVSPSVWHPASGSPSQTFTATVTDAPERFPRFFQWHTSDPGIVSVSPFAGPTSTLTCHYPKAYTDQASLSVDASVGDETVTAHFVHDPSGSPNGIRFAMDMPSTLFVDNDDDNGDGTLDMAQTPGALDEDAVDVNVRFTAPQTTNATIQIMGDPFWGWFYDGDVNSRRSLSDGNVWEIEGASRLLTNVCLSATDASESYLGSAIAFLIDTGDGENLQFHSRFTVVEPVVEPICTETTNVVEDGVERTPVVNPCGIGVGRDAYFRIGLAPEDYPDEDIVWTATGFGAVDFPDGNTGRAVRVRGVAEGDVYLNIQIGDCESDKPMFHARVVTNTVTKISAWIVTSGSKPVRALYEVEEMVQAVNDIYAQVNMSFYLDSVTVTNIDAAYDLAVEDPPRDGWNFDRLVDIASNTGGLEVYFINRFTDEDNRETTALHCASGIVMSDAATGTTLAHEIGHACGMHDIYSYEDDCAIPLDEPIRRDYALYDWNNGSYHLTSAGGRYYAPGTRHVDVIERLLMFGRKSSVKRDIPYGDVSGIVKVGEGLHEAGTPATGFLESGQGNRNPVHR